MDQIPLAHGGDEPRRSKTRTWTRWALAAGLVAGVGLFFALELDEHFSWEKVRSQVSHWQAQVHENLIVAVLVFFFLYVAVTGLSLPGALVLSLAAGALFGFWLGTALVSLASTAGATLAFLSSRYILRSWVQRRFGRHLKAIDEGIRRDGAYYLFTLRLIPLFPFFLINLAMGLTALRLWTYVWVSWLGMLPATLVFLYAGAAAGAALATIETPQEMLSPGLLIALVLLGVAPLAFRKMVQWRVKS